MEPKLSQMILDKKLHGILDQGAGCIELFDEPVADKTYVRVVVWLCGCVVVWLCGCVVVWLCGCVVVWLCGCVVVWLCGSGVMVLCVATKPTSAQV